jgi:hypothetical protein
VRLVGRTAVLPGARSSRWPPADVAASATRT